MGQNPQPELAPDGSRRQVMCARNVKTHLARLCSSDPWLGYARRRKRLVSVEAAARRDFIPGPPEISLRHGRIVIR